MGLFRRWRHARRSRRIAAGLVGLHVDEATSRAKVLRYDVREVSHRNGATFWTLDGRPFRITLWADETDTVVRAEWS